MKNGKYGNGKQRPGMKPLTILLALTLLLGCAIGGVIAWLTAETGEVTNTFTIGDINIQLKEHKLLENGELDEKDEVTENAGYQFVPGDTLPKDPFVRVTADSESCYVFIKITEINNNLAALNGKVINWAVRDGWTEYKPKATGFGTVSYYYRVVEQPGAGEAALEDQVFYILTGGDKANKFGQITVNPEITKEMVKSLTDNKPMLKFDAAAVQTANIADVDEAFKQIVWTD